MLYSYSVLRSIATGGASAELDLNEAVQAFINEAYYGRDQVKKISDGWRNIDRYIGDDSQVVFNYIEGVPIGGISDLTTQSRYNEEVGYDVNSRNGLDRTVVGAISVTI